MRQLIYLIIGICLGINIMILLTPKPLERIYESYNHIKIYEDGSYVAETRDGQPEQGCIKKALCNNSEKENE